MKTNHLKKHHTFSLLLSGLLFSGVMLVSYSAYAEKPASHPQEKGKHGRGDSDERRGGDRHGEGRSHDDRSYDDRRDRDNISISLHFGDRQRGIVHDYYDRDYRSGSCPPGLAKKRNGCIPPGQARKWSRGHPLPRDVVFYDLPPRLVVELGAPPAGHKYVRVAADILLIAVGTSMVVDAIEDLGNM